MLSRLPINVTAPILVAVPVLLLGLWLSLMWNRLSRESVTDLSGQNTRQIHNLAERKITDMVSIPPRICELNAYLVHTGVLDPDNLAAWRPLLFREMTAFDMISALTWGSEDGRSAWVARYADGTSYWDLKDDPSIPTMMEWRMDEHGDIPDTPTSRFDYDLFSRPWYKTPREQGQATWSAPYVWVGGQDSEIMTLGISYGIPLYNPDGSLQGVIDADLSLNDLSSFLQSMSIGKSGQAVLVTREGLLLASSKTSTFATPEGQLIHVTDSRSPMVAAAGQVLGQDHRTGTEATEITIEDDTHHVLVSRVGKSVGLDWQLVTILPERDFLSQIDEEFRRSTIISIAAVIAAMLIGIVAARWLLKPLFTLGTAVRQVGQGDLETRVQIKHAPEYINLGKAINQMVRGLQRSREQEILLIRELDHRVKNMLAQIAALCRQKSEQASEDRELLDDLVGQVESLSGVHELLGKSGQVSLPLHELIQECCSPYLESSEQLSVDGPDLYVKPQAAMCLALICNELATNARKYGSLSSSAGKVTINWSTRDDDQGDQSVHWSWIEGDGPTPSGSIVSGFGMQMLREMIPFEVSGTVDMQFTPGGLQFLATVPIEYFSASDPDQSPGEELAS